jgi:hypothetical protein
MDNKLIVARCWCGSYVRAIGDYEPINKIYNCMEIWEERGYLIDVIDHPITLTDCICIEKWRKMAEDYECIKNDILRFNLFMQSELGIKGPDGVMGNNDSGHS